jgi:hypothetical protein
MYSDGRDHVSGKHLSEMKLGSLGCPCTSGEKPRGGSRCVNTSSGYEGNRAESFLKSQKKLTFLFCSLEVGISDVLDLSIKQLYMN